MIFDLLEKLNIDFISAKDLKNKELNRFLSSYDHEGIYFFCSPKVNLRAIVAIHNTKLGPATGGTRIWPYNSFWEAITDALNLSRAMTYKTAAADLNFGGGKAVIWLNPENKTRELLRTYAKYLKRLRGKFYTGEDANVSLADVKEMASVAPEIIVGKDKNSDPGRSTAEGIRWGMKASLNFLNMGGLKGKSVVLQGVGNVGSQLLKLLLREGANLYVSDTSHKRLEDLKRKFNFKIIPPSEAHKVKCHIYSPCLTRGGIFNKKTIPELKCRIIAGSTNNQLSDPITDSRRLFKRGIVYVPDYIINAGGLIDVKDELNPPGYSPRRVAENLRKIYNRTYQVLYWSKKLNISSQEIANVLAESKFIPTLES